MTSIVLSTLLLVTGFEFKDYRVTWPSPYLGMGMTMFKEVSVTADGEKITRYPKWLTIGLPVKVAKKNESATDPLVAQLIVTPEFGYSSRFFMFNAMLGFESGTSLGYRQRLSALMYGLQGGLHYGLLLSDYTNEDGSAMSSNDKTAFGVVFSGYTGPRFEFTENLAFKFMINPRFIVGIIPKHTYRSEFAQRVGAQIAFNFQLEFL